MAPKKKGPPQKRGKTKEELAEEEFAKRNAERAAKNAPPPRPATPSQGGGITVMHKAASSPSLAKVSSGGTPLGRPSGGLTRVASAVMLHTSTESEIDPDEENELVEKVEQMKANGTDGSNAAANVMRLVGLMARPSRSVQTLAANCVADFASVLADADRKALVGDLLARALSPDAESVEGSKSGAAIGAAAVIRPQGIAALEGLMPPVRAILTDRKEAPPARMAAATALGAFARTLGRPFEPSCVEMAHLLLPLLQDGNIEVRTAAVRAIDVVFGSMTPQGAKSLLPDVAKGLKNSEKWQTKSGALEVLGLFSRRYPRQLCDAMPTVYPQVLESLSDSHPQVKEAALRVLPDICAVISYPEVKGIVNPHLLDAITRPVEATEACLDALLDITFVNAVDAPALAVLMPVVTRGLRGNKAFLKNSAAKIVGNMCALVMYARDLAPYVPILLPELKKLAVDSSPDVRLIAAKAVASLVMGMGGPLVEVLLPQLTRMQESMVTVATADGRARAGVELQALVDGEVNKAAAAATQEEAGHGSSERKAEAHIQEALTAALGDGTPALVGEYATRNAGTLLTELVEDGKGHDPTVSALRRCLACIEPLVAGGEEACGALCEKLVAEYLRDTGVEVAHDDRIVNLNGIILAFASRVLLQRTHLHMDRGHVYGLVGQNGVGKTTLMTRVAKGDIHNFPTHLKCVYVQHEVHRGVRDDGESVLEFMVAELPEEGEEAIRGALESVGFSAKMRGSPVADLSGGWRMKLAIARAMLQNADILLLDEPTNHLDVQSIAWLASYVTSIKHCTVMLVSHDQAFMSKVVTDVIHIHDRKLTYYDCGFSEFREQNPVLYLKATNLAEDSELAAAGIGGPAGEGGEEDAAAAAAPAGDGHEVNNPDFTSQPFFFPNPGKLEGIKSKTKPVLTMTDVSYSYPGAEKPTLTGVSCKLTMGSRVAILGANGAGKTTMMKMLVGESVPDDGVGEVWKHHNLRLSYVAQHSMHHLEENLLESPVKYFQDRFGYGKDREVAAKVTLKLTPEEEEVRTKRGEIAEVFGRRTQSKELQYEVLRNGRKKEESQWLAFNFLKTQQPYVLKLCKAYDEFLAQKAAGTDLRPVTITEIKKHLADFGINDVLATGKIKNLSGGQRARVVLASAMWSLPHLLALDEPTNYIDVETLNYLAKAIDAFPGGVFMISHNHKFVDEVCHESWTVADGTLKKPEKMRAGKEKKDRKDRMKKGGAAAAAAAEAEDAE